MDIDTNFEVILSNISNFKNSISLLQNQLKNLEKIVKKEVRTLKKEVQKGKSRGNRKPSGFAKPAVVSDELCKFMGKDKGTEVARTEVTRYLIQYIKSNSLQHPDNKKVILPDEQLRTLLGVNDNEEVTYFNLQRLMNKHFS